MKLSFLVEVETTRHDPENVIHKLRQEMQLMYGDAVKVMEWKEPIHWVSGG